MSAASARTCSHKLHSRRVLLIYLLLLLLLRLLRQDPVPFRIELVPSEEAVLLVILLVLLLLLLALLLRRLVLLLLLVLLVRRRCRRQDLFRVDPCRLLRFEAPFVLRRLRVVLLPGLSGHGRTDRRTVRWADRQAPWTGAPWHRLPSHLNLWKVGINHTPRRHQEASLPVSRAACCRVRESQRPTESVGE